MACGSYSKMSDVLWLHIACGLYREMSDALWHGGNRSNIIHIMMVGPSDLTIRFLMSPSINYSMPRHMDFSLYKAQPQDMGHPIVQSATTGHGTSPSTKLAAMGHLDISLYEADILTNQPNSRLYI